MKIEGSAEHYGKRIAKLEAQCDQLKLEKINLKEELMEVKGKEEKMIEMCAKVKDKYAKAKEEFGSKERMWREEEENLMEMCRQVGVEKRKLEIDLKEAKQRFTNSIVEMAQKLMAKDLHFKSFLEENNRGLGVAFEARMTKMKEEFDLKERKWREEEEKIREECRQLNFERRKLELDLNAANRGIGDCGDGVPKKLKAAEAEAEGLKSLLEEKEGSIIALLAKNENLEWENKRFEMDFHAKMTMEAKKHKVEEGKILELTQKIGILEREKREIEANLQLVNMEMSEEISRILNEKVAVEVEKMTMEAESKKKIYELVLRIEKLEEEKKELEAKVCQANNEKSAEINRILIEKEALEDEKRAEEDGGKTKVSELVRRIEVLEGGKKKMEAKVCQEKKKDEEIQRILNEKIAIEDEKRAVKEDYEKKILEFDDRNDILEREKRQFEAEIAERDEVMNVLAQQNSCLEDKIEEMEMNGLASTLKVKEGQILELTLKIEVLKGEKGQMEAEYYNLKKDNRRKDQRIFSLNKVLEAEKKRGKIAREKITEHVKRIGVLERIKETEKITMEEESKKMVLELTHRIEVLEREKREIEAKVCQAMKEKSEEIEKIQNVMMALEVEKRTREDEGTRRIEVLKREKNEMEAKVCQAKQEMSEEIQRILNGKRAVMEDYEKKIWKLVDKNDNWERGKQGFEAEIAERDKVVKVLVQQNSCLEGKKKELEMEINGLAAKYEHLTNNVVMLTTPWPNEGQNSTDGAPSSEHNGSIIHNAENRNGKYEDEMTHSHVNKRKRSIRK